MQVNKLCCGSLLLFYVAQKVTDKLTGSDQG